MAEIATLRPGTPFEGVCACTRKERLTARTGSPYLTLGHVVIGLQIVDRRIAALDGFPAERKLALEHCIVTHHGPSGPRFGSAEALALYRLNQLDVSVKDTLEHAR